MTETKTLNFPKGIFGKIVNTKNGSIGKVSVKKKDFIEYLQSLPETEEYLNLDILKRINPTDKHTHYIVVDDWKPTKNVNNEHDELFNFSK